MARPRGERMRVLDMRIRTMQKETTVSASRDKNTARKLPRGSSGGFSGEETMKQRAKTCLQNGEEWVRPGCEGAECHLLPRADLGALSADPGDPSHAGCRTAAVEAERGSTS